MQQEISSTHTSKKRRLRLPFNVIEVILFVVILAVLGVSTFLVLNPQARLNSADDNKRREEIEKIHTGIILFQVDKGGEFPTLANDTELPSVTTQDIMQKGLAADELVGMDEYYNGKIPKDPSGQSYRVGTAADGSLLVAIRLTNGEVYVAKGVNAPKPKVAVEE